MGAGQGEREGSAPAAGRSLGLPSWKKVPRSQPGSHGVAGTWSHIWGVHQAGGNGGEPLGGVTSAPGRNGQVMKASGSGCRMETVTEGSGFLFQASLLQPSCLKSSEAISQDG